jgi:hypothetical protein
VGAVVGGDQQELGPVAADLAGEVTAEVQTGLDHAVAVAKEGDVADADELGAGLLLGDPDRPRLLGRQAVDSGVAVGDDDVADPLASSRRSITVLLSSAVMPPMTSSAGDGRTVASGGDASIGGIVRHRRCLPQWAGATRRRHRS